MPIDPHAPLCQPEVLLDPKGLTLRERLGLAFELRHKFRRLELRRRMNMLGTVQGGNYVMRSYDHDTLRLLAVAAEHNFIRPWFMSRLEVRVEWLPQAIS